MPKRIGILGGSFNPVHIGHTLLAEYIVQYTDIDEVWLMLSPQNPLKEHDYNISDADRLAMLELATKHIPGVKPCDIELTMPRPSYTINSLTKLATQYPDNSFSLIIGSDNWQIFDRWKDYKQIINLFNPLIYPRPDYPIEPNTLPPEVQLINQPPTFLISSTFIRAAISTGHDMTRFLPAGIYQYIKDHKLYLKP